MRGDCRYFQKRMYGTSETVQFCALGLAPEAPWRCPAECPRYERRVERPRWAPVLGTGAGAGDDGGDELGETNLSAGAADVLGAAQGIIRAAGPEIVAEHERRRRREASAPWWQRLRQQAPWRRSL